MSLMNPTARESDRAPWKLTVFLVVIFVILAGALWVISGKKRISPGPPANHNTGSAEVVPQPHTIDFGMSGVGKGEGVESPLIRQLIANPSIAGYKGKNDPKAIKRWAQHEAHVRARNAKLVGATVTQRADTVIAKQLLADPASAGYTGSNDPKAIREWARQEARTRAQKAGLVSWKYEKRREVRVKKPGTVAFVFEKDDKGELQIVEYMIATTNQSSATSSTGFVTTTGAQLVRTGAFPATATIGVSASRGAERTLVRAQEQYLYLHTG